MPQMLSGCVDKAQLVLTDNIPSILFARCKSASILLLYKSKYDLFLEALLLQLHEAKFVTNYLAMNARTLNTHRPLAACFTTKKIPESSPFTFQISQTGS